MDDLCCNISLLNDDVVTLIVEDLDDFQFVVQQVVGVKTQELVSVSHFPIYLDFHPTVDLRSAI